MTEAITSSVTQEFSGVGVLRFNDGTSSQCSFLVRQTTAGDLTLECEHVDHRPINWTIGSGS
jgi:hypothetical protein